MNYVSLIGQHFNEEVLVKEIPTPSRIIWLSSPIRVDRLHNIYLESQSEVNSGSLGKDGCLQIYRTANENDPVRGTEQKQKKKIPAWRL